jgi:hypothetical protein
MGNRWVATRIERRNIWVARRRDRKYRRAATGRE